MARGWESKHVEEQQAETSRRRDAARGRTLTAAERALEQRRETLRLAEASTRAALDAARIDTHRDMLRMQLDAIRREIGALTSAD
jgi:hypothetical protein